MDLDPTMHRELAVFFHRRFPHGEQRRQIAALARVHAPEPPEQRGEVAWGVLLTRAAEQGRLERLIDAVLAQPEVDAALHEVCALVQGRPWPPVPESSAPPLLKPILGLAALAAVGLAFVAVRALSGGPGGFAEPVEIEPTAEELAAAEALRPEDELELALLRTALPPAANASAAAPPPPAQPARQTVARSPSAPPPPAAAAPAPSAPAATAAPPAPAAVAPAAAAPAAAPPAAAAPAAAPPAAATPAAAPPAAKPPPTAPTAKAPPPAAQASVGGVPGPAALDGRAVTANHHGRCTTAAGGLVGWWHAGSTAPGAQGEVIRIRHGARVRLDLPRPANRFDARAPERCALFEGDQVRLTGAPVQIAGGSWWVPLHSGDLIRP